MSEAQILPGAMISEGKTKQILEIPGNADRVILRSKDDITAGDGKKHDALIGKAELANTTTCNVFTFLKKCGIPVAFVAPWNRHAFVATRCKMISLEVVVRREAHGSYLKRNPHVSKGVIFPRLLVEFYLKTSGRKWGTVPLPCDDPIIRVEDGIGHLFEPSKPIYGQDTFLSFPISQIAGEEEGDVPLGAIEASARVVFLALERAWQILGRRLVDIKFEFGFSSGGDLLLADVVDNDSWRVFENGEHIDKQCYRDGEDLMTVLRKYKLVAGLTGQFQVPRQRVIIWRGSISDNVDEITSGLCRFAAGSKIEIVTITRSWHKEPAAAYLDLQKAVQEVPDCVIIAFIGRSNGAGPAIAANCSVPVITVPVDYRGFADDVWSSLRMPSGVPLMTVLDPANAAFAACQILAFRNPALYANLRYSQEQRMANMLPVS